MEPYPELSDSFSKLDFSHLRMERVVCSSSSRSTGDELEAPAPSSYLREEARGEPRNGPLCEAPSPIF
jgi:hypothetical protein